MIEGLGAKDLVRIAGGEPSLRLCADGVRGGGSQLLPAERRRIRDRSCRILSPPRLETGERCLGELSVWTANAAAAAPQRVPRPWCGAGQAIVDGRDRTSTTVTIAHTIPAVTLATTPAVPPAARKAGTEGRAEMTIPNPPLPPPPPLPSPPPP